jgi:hypothetical protein
MPSAALVTQPCADNTRTAPSPAAAAQDPEQWTWFPTSPDAGDPDCLCSVCAQRIPAHRHLVRFWRSHRECRICEGCLLQCELGTLIVLASPET